ncbi:MAG: VRR-NUC domain-containing protein [Chitinophagaceae bacterium]|nr:VRR-NUC domain-containing protein [Chitinophagaceae bacterium]
MNKKAAEKALKKTSEKTLERKIVVEVKRLGGKALKFYCLSFTGMPDRIILLPDARVFFAEIKTTGKKPSPRQRFVHNWLRGLGFVVVVIDSAKALDDFLNEIKN